MKSIPLFQYMSIKKYFSLFLFCLMQICLLAQQSDKIKGLSLLGPQKADHCHSIMVDIQDSQANWMAFIPQATLERKTLTLLFDQPNDWWSQTIPGTIEGIRAAKKKGFNIMLKPHIILEKVKPKSSTLEQLLTVLYYTDKTAGADWRGNFKARNEEDWKIWENNYEEYILRLAQVAESMEVSLFCVGTELRASTVNRPQFWRKLIKKVKAIYKGPITYSANWDEYEQVTFWDELDYIGVNAYFPISNSATPQVSNTLKNWQPILQKMQQISQKYQRKFIITEFGYQNVDYAGHRPWTHHYQNATPNHQSQINLYEAFFQSFWSKSWIAGGFLWEWFSQPSSSPDIHFSPQNKPAIATLQKWYQ